MKLTKTLENAILKLYNTWLHSYLNGDTKTYDSYLDFDYHFIGSTDNEEFLDRKATINFFKATAEQLAGKCDFRNETKTIELFENLIFITHVFDAWFLNENEWTYYSRFRFSSTLQEKEEGWRFIYQHFSIPDSKTNEGETIGFDKVNLENQELREAIKRRTFELEEKNRELEVEGALERVRARSMAMQNSDELKDVIKIVYKQLNLLKIKLDHAGFVVDYTPKGDWHFWIADEQDVPSKITHPYFNSVWATQFNEAKEKGIDFFVTNLNFKEKNKFYNELLSYIPGLPETSKEFYLSCPGLAATTVIFDNISLYIENFDGIAYTNEENLILIRFAKVFQQTYTRFLDLQKAEAQAREAQIEAQIEASLERVRSRSMSMHKSDELREAGDLLCSEIKKLGIETITSGYVIMEDDENIGWNYAPNTHTGKILELAVGVPHNDTAIMRSVKAAWKKQEPFFVVEMNETETIAHQTFIAEQGINFPISANQLIAASPPKLKLHNFNFKEGYLIIVGGTKLSEEQENMMLRFTKVFQQSYTRFLDLQKAEAQTREAQIEAALERVRSRSMAMHTSEELLDVITVVSEQLQHLEFKFVHVSFANNDMGQDYKFWTSSPGRSEPMRFNVPYKDIAVFNNLRKAQEKSLPFCTDVLTKKEHNQWHTHLLKHGGFEVFSKADNEFIMSRGMARSTAVNPNIMLILGNYASIPYSDEENEIIARFGQVFEQAYTRFLDLQNAEALTKVAQIEAALEKVRSVALGLKKSDDMLDIAQVLYEQLLVLGFNDMRNAIIDIHNDDNETFIDYDYSHDMSSAITQFSFYGDPVIEKQIKTVQSSNDAFFEIELRGEQLKELIATRLLNGEKDDPRLHKIDHLTYNLYSFGNGAIGISNFGALSDDQKKILKRFRNVFTFAYKRYTDLATAEAQTKEAQIEAALEKVRSVALGLNKSEELVNIAEVLYNQLFTLGFKNIRNAIIDIHIDDKGGFLDYDYSPEIGKSITKMNYYDHPIIEKQVQQFQSTSDGFFEIILEGKDLKNLIALRIKNGEAEDKRLNKAKQLTYNLYSFGEGEIGISTFGLLDEKQIVVLKRFRNVFSFAYNRYNELKEAEIRTRELQIEAALEKIRSRSLSMLATEELGEVVTLLVKKLMELNLVLDANGVIICTYFENSKDVLHWMSSPDFSLAGSYLLPYFDHPIFNDAWNSKEAGDDYFSKAYTVAEKNSFFEYAFEHSDYKLFPDDFKQWIFQNDKHILTFAWQKNSAILIPSHTGVLPTDAEKSILIRFSKVFEQAYVRFLDLKKAEVQTIKAKNDLVIIKKARKDAEKSLAELQSTQKQLIQSEKMASLGELTAGIAHEIQNPLNFVNNFSEVSAELLAEMQDEINNGNLEDAKEILIDVLQNLEKINHHGKRADAIVKGMLQHSRSNSDKKEPTDLNALCDEYLRLSFHGLRAKDKSFNATIKTDFDESIENINIIPQDFGRVILNLLTNAFYAVTEKKHLNIEGYEPTVTIATKKENDKIIIQVSDNGNGMPKEIMDKVYQPFFTTKPAGQGTGLGLSMSYDIITKGHNGELKVESEQGEGSTFTIILNHNN